MDVQYILRDIGQSIDLKLQFHITDIRKGSTHWTE